MMPSDHQSQHTPYWAEEEGLSREVRTSGAMYSGVPTGRAALDYRRGREGGEGRGREGRLAANG